MEEVKFTLLLNDVRLKHLTCDESLVVRGVHQDI